MSPDETRTNQRIFEVGGSIMCGLLFGLILWLVETRFQDRSSLASYAHLAWSVFLSLASYLSICYLLDRQYEKKQWRIRLNPVFISVIGTSLLFMLALLPNLVADHMRGSDYQDDRVMAYIALVILLNILVLGAMGGVWFLGFVMRVISGEAAHFKVVP